MASTAAPPIPESATAGQIARVLGTTERSVLGRTSDGRLPRTAAGHVDLHAVIQAGVTALATRGPQDGVPGLEQEKARLASEQADQIAMKNAASRRELVSRQQIGDAVVGMIEIAKSRLAKVPAKAFPNVADMRFRKAVADAIHDALLDLSAERAMQTVERP